jgi:hypothetical protein
MLETLGLLIICVGQHKPTALLADGLRVPETLSLIRAYGFWLPTNIRERSLVFSMLTAVTD